MSWVELNQDDGNIAITPPNFYAVTASVKTTHSSDDIINLARGHGLNVFQYSEGADDGGGYRQVSLQAQAVSPNTIPWKAPFPLNIADGSHITRAWMSPPVGVPTTNPVTPVAAQKSLVPWAIGGIATAAAGIFLTWWLSKK
jgi:hypothetical protein